MEPARGGRSSLDRIVGDAVAERIKEPDIFVSMSDFGSDTLERTRHPSEVGFIVDDRNHPRGRLQIADPKVLE
jgi:hypothetical protein